MKSNARGSPKFYRTIDLPLAPVLAAMERIGIHIDPRALETMSAEMEREIRALESRIWELAGNRVQRQFARAACGNSFR